MKNKNFFTWFFTITVGIPLTLALGFFVSYELVLHFQTPGYTHYGMPLRTDFFSGCEIYSTFDMKNIQGVIIGEDTSWHSCPDYRKYIENKNYLNQSGNE